MTCSSSAQQYFNKRDALHSFSSIITSVVPLNDKYYCTGLCIDSVNYSTTGQTLPISGIKFAIFDNQGNKLRDTVYQQIGKSLDGWSNNLLLMPNNNLVLAVEEFDTSQNYSTLLVKIDTMGAVTMGKQIDKPLCMNEPWMKVVDIKPIGNNQFIMLSRMSCKALGQPLKVDILLTKLDSDFNVIWHKQYGSGQTNNAAWKLLIEPDGYLIAGGRNNLNQTSMNFSLRAMLMKTDTAGNVQWTWLSDPSKKTFEAKDVIRTQDGGYVYCGSGDGYEILGANGTWSIPRFRGWVEKLDSNRNVVWSRAFNDFYDGTEFKKVIEAPDGRLFLFGNKLYADTTIGSVYIKHTFKVGF
jgi:hypothetical protein